MAVGVKVGKQGTAGTAASTFISVPAAFDSKYVKENRVVEEVRSGQDVRFSVLPGLEREEWTIGQSHIYDDSLGAVLNGLFGTAVSTAGAGAAAPAITNVWTFTDSTPYLTLQAIQPRRSVEPYQIVDAVVNSMQFAFEAEGVVSFACDGMGVGRTSIAAPTYAFSTRAPFTAWRGTATIDGAANAKIRKGTIGITRNRKPLYTLANSTDPNTWSYGARAVDFDMTIDFSSITEYDYFRNNTTKALKFSFADDQTISTSGLTGLFSVELFKVAFETGEIDTNEDLPSVNLKGKALVDSAGKTIEVTVRSGTNFQTA